MSYVAAISLLTTIALGFVVFAFPQPSYGVWDDLTFLVSALVFLWSVVRLLGARASDAAHAAHALLNEESPEDARPASGRTRNRSDHQPADPG